MFIYKLIFAFLSLFPHKCAQFHEYTKNNKILINEISTLGYIKLTDNYISSFKDTPEYDKHIKCLVNQYLYKCNDIMNRLKKRLCHDFENSFSCRYRKSIFLSKFTERVFFSVETIKKEIDDIYKTKHKYYNDFLEKYWDEYNKYYFIKKKNEYIKLINIKIRKKGCLKQENILQLVDFILKYFAKSYLKRAIFMAAMFFNDKEAIVEFLSGDDASIFLKNFDDISPAKDSCVYNAIKFITKYNNQIEIIREPDCPNKTADFVEQLFKTLFYKDLDINEEVVEIVEDGFPSGFTKNRHFINELVYEGKIGNLIPSYEKYVQFLRNNKNKFVGVHLLFIEIDLNKELNEKFQNKDIVYMVEFLQTLFYFLKKYLESRFRYNIKIVLIWKEIKLYSFFETLEKLSKRNSIEWIETNRGRFLKKLTSIYESFKMNFDDVIFYKGFNEPDKDKCDDSFVARDKILKSVFCDWEKWIDFEEIEL